MAEYTDPKLGGRRYDLFVGRGGDAFECEARFDAWGVVDRLLTAERASVPPEKLWFVIPDVALETDDYGAMRKYFNHIVVRCGRWGAGYSIARTRRGSPKSLLSELGRVAMLIESIPRSPKKLAALRDRVQEQTPLPRCIVRWLTVRSNLGRLRGD